MKLYTYDSAPNPARLKMFIEYKGLDIDTQQIDMAKMEQHSPEYLAIVPEATIPVLVLDDGCRITEVVAIARYLESIYPDRPLLGKTPLEQAMVLNWNHRLFHSVFMACAEAFRNTHPAFKNRGLPGTKPVAQIPELAERGRERLKHGLEIIDSELANRDFLAGADFSFADIDLLALLSFAKWAAKVEPDASLVNLAQWRNRAEAARTAGV